MEPMDWIWLRQKCLCRSWWWAGPCGLYWCQVEQHVDQLKAAREIVDILRPWWNYDDDTVRTSTFSIQFLLFKVLDSNTLLLLPFPAKINPLPTHLLLLYMLASLAKKKKKKKKKTYNSRDSLVVTHPTTNRPACGLSTAERTGSPVFHTLWSYVLTVINKGEYIMQELWSTGWLGP